MISSEVPSNKPPSVDVNLRRDLGKYAGAAVEAMNMIGAIAEDIAAIRLKPVCETNLIIWDKNTGELIHHYRSPEKPQND